MAMLESIITTKSMAFYPHASYTLSAHSHILKLFVFNWLVDTLRIDLSGRRVGHLHQALLISLA